MSNRQSSPARAYLRKLRKPKKNCEECGRILNTINKSGLCWQCKYWMKTYYGK